MSTSGRQADIKGDLTEESERSQEERNLKRRQDDDIDSTSKRSDRTASKKNKATIVNRHEETFRFDSTTSSTDGECWIQTTLAAQIVSHCWLLCNATAAIVESRATAPHYSESTESNRFPLAESCSLESIQQLMELPRFSNVTQPPTLCQSVFASLNSNSVSSLPVLETQLSQYQLTQDLTRTRYAHNDANHLSALLSSLGGSNIANPLNERLFEAQPLSLAQMPFIGNTRGHFPSSDNNSDLAFSRDGEVNDLFQLSNSLRPVQAILPDSTQVKSDHREKKATKDHNPNRLTLYVSADDGMLNENQIFLRQNIELFQATQNDIMCLTRGKNKPIVLHQVGIRCCHCSQVPVGRRKKGSTYFPSNLLGLYQAAQNLSVEHLQTGLCTEMPPNVRERFSGFAMGKRSGVSGAGKTYWAEAGRMLGLIDTDDGIRFASDRVDCKKAPESC
jgi:hypothetical protein